MRTLKEATKNKDILSKASFAELKPLLDDGYTEPLHPF